MFIPESPFLLKDLLLQQKITKKNVYTIVDQLNP